MKKSNKVIIYNLRMFANGLATPGEDLLGVGICYYLWCRSERKDLEDILMDNIHNWKYYSGSKAFPVPSDIDDLSAAQRYYLQGKKDKFCLGETTDQYILYRRDLCKWFADYIENNL